MEQMEEEIPPGRAERLQEFDGIFGRLQELTNIPLNVNGSAGVSGAQGPISDQASRSGPGATQAVDADGEDDDFDGLERDVEQYG